MKVELKNIKIVQALSEETLCFTAVAYVDGIKTFYVSNRGHGGCHEYTEVDCKPETRARFDAVDAWAKTLPPDHYGDLELPSDLDSVVNNALVEYEMRQLLKRITKNKIAYVDDGKLWTVKLEYSPARLDKLLQKKPNAKVLNIMLESEAIALLKVAA
jgi:hypothetical protein